MNLVVGDIGGTNARFAFQENQNSDLELFDTFLCSDFNSFEDIILNYITKHNIKIKNLSVSIAAPCENDDVLFTNNDLSFKKSLVSKKFKLESFLAINDFVAQSIVFKPLLFSRDTNSISKILTKLDLVQIKRGTPLLNSSLFVTGPGTGLGACTLKRFGNQVITIAGEGGNAFFSPRDHYECSLLNEFLKKKTYVSFEDFISGKGIQNLYNILQKKNNLIVKNLTPSEIGELAIKNDELAVLSVKQMLKMFVTFIVNNIFLNGCLNGVIICGGIAIRLKDFLSESIFINEYKKIHNYFNYLNNVPIYLCVNDKNGLIGARDCFYDNYFNKFKINYN